MAEASSRALLIGAEVVHLLSNEDSDFDKMSMMEWMSSFQEVTMSWVL